MFTFLTVPFRMRGRSGRHYTHEGAIPDQRPHALGEENEKRFGQENYVHAPACGMYRGGPHALNHAR